MLDIHLIRLVFIIVISCSFFYRILFCSIKDDAAVVVFVSKMIPVRLADVSKRDIVVLKNNRREQRKRDGGR